MKGTVTRLVTPRGFGFIQDGVQEWFFHKKDCLAISPFLALRIGDEVEFEVRDPPDPKGPQAVQVRLAGLGREEAI